jgi:hypothetical protein
MDLVVWAIRRTLSSWLSRTFAAGIAGLLGLWTPAS